MRMAAVRNKTTMPAALNVVMSLYICVSDFLSVHVSLSCPLSFCTILNLVLLVSTFLPSGCTQCTGQKHAFSYKVSNVLL